MRYVVTIRDEEEKYSQVHIVDTDSVLTLCGKEIPDFILMDLESTNPLKNPYIGKGMVTCLNCVISHVGKGTT